MANQSPRPILPVNVPVNFPTVPTPGKISILFNANKKELYHKLSPYGSETFFGIKTRQPFFYTYPDEKKNSSDLFIVDLFKKSTQDVVRVSKWMISREGILFSANQFLMQTGNAFNETRIWNVTSPIVAAGMPLTLWAARPTRHIDTSDLLGSFLGSLGKTIGGIFGTGTRIPRPPPGTVGTALPPFARDGGKGLIRAGTANPALANLNRRWSPPTKSGLNLGGFLSATIKGMFGNFLPQRQVGISKRSDEKTYGKMIQAGNAGMFEYEGPRIYHEWLQQRWIAGSVGGIRESGQNNSTYGGFLLQKPNGDPVSYNALSDTIKVSLKGPMILVGATAFESTVKYEPGIRYENTIGLKARDQDGMFFASKIMMQWGLYAEEGKQYPSKMTEPNKVTELKDSLSRRLSALRKSTVYNFSGTPDNGVFRSVFTAKDGYERLAAIKGVGEVETQYGISTLQAYRDSRVLENQHSSMTGNAVKLSKKMASSHQFDGINTLTVLDKDKKITPELIGGWTEWRPYYDDQIAFYFYDVVNEKYVPFRAIIRGLQETDSATWEELSFVGRADRLYNYSGFNRSLTFSFTVHINSIVEMAPTWQRINYLMSLVKPSRYTIKDNGNSSLYTRFMVPPMVMVTIGDLYRNQPVVLASAGMSIPDTAIWETLNADNSDEWSYLVDYIKAPKIGKLYAQLPLTVDISINAYILEQERAIVGAAHFGKAPHNEDYKKGDYRRTLPDKELPNEFHKSLVVYQEQKSSNYEGDININPVNENIG